MTTGFFADFLARKAQVGRYLEVVETHEQAMEPGKASAAATEQLNVLRAGHFLILYNLVEASLRGAVEAIHDRIVTERVPLQQLTDTIRRDVIRSFKARCDPDKHLNMNDIPIELVAVALDIDAGYPFSGNVDAKKVREMADIYGFDTTTPREVTRDGADLLTVKSLRNDLAHGDKTYDEVGRNYTATDLKGLSDRSIAYVEAILTRVDRFVTERRFLRSPPP
jgi:hypothetical protein